MYDGSHYRIYYFDYEENIAGPLKDQGEFLIDYHSGIAEWLWGFVINQEEIYTAVRKNILSTDHQ